MFNTGKIKIASLFGRYQAGLQLGKTPEDENAILKIQPTNYPNFLFEWHPKSKNLYVIRLLKNRDGSFQSVQQGELVAFNITNHGAAQNAVLIWLRGYQTAENEEKRVPFLKAEDYS